MTGQDSITQVFKTSSLAPELYMQDMGTMLVQRPYNPLPAWVFIYFLVLLGLFAWIRLYYGNNLALTLKAAINYKVSARMFMDKSLLQNQLDSILFALYFLTMSFLLCFVENRLSLIPYGLSGIKLYLFNLVLLMVIFFGRVFLVSATGFFFNRMKLFREYLYNVFIFNKIMGIVALPLLLFLVYTRGSVQEFFFWLAAAVFLLIIVIRLSRGIAFSFRKDVLLFYMFLYLCALEIVPVVLVYRWIEGVL